MENRINFDAFEILIIKKGIEIIKKEMLDFNHTAQHNDHKKLYDNAKIKEAFDELHVKINAAHTLYNKKYWNVANHKPTGGIKTAVNYGQNYIKHKLKNKF